GMLEQARKLGNQDGALYTIWMEVGVGQGYSHDRETELFKAALQCNPSDLEPYQIMTNYLLPRWYGSQAALKAFAEASPASGRAAITGTLVGFEKDALDWPGFSWTEVRPGVLDLLHETAGWKHWDAMNLALQLGRAADDKKFVEEQSHALRQWSEGLEDQAGP